MKVEISVDKEQKTPLIRVVTSEITDEVRELAERLSFDYADTLNAYCERGVRILRNADVIRIYAENQKIFCETADGVYTLRQRLYELEKRLDAHTFVRISNSEIVNLRKIVRLEASFTGTVCVNLEGGHKSYSSRRYVRIIKSKFGL